MSAYKSISVSCMDLARVLDWCDQSRLITPSGRHARITEDPYWFGEAYHNLAAELRRQLPVAASTETHTSRVYSARFAGHSSTHGGTAHV